MNDRSDAPALPEPDDDREFEYSGWDMAMSRYRPAGCRTHVGAQMADGSYVSGWLFSFNPDGVESEHREIVLTEPSLRTADGDAAALIGCSFSVLSARHIERLDVTHIDVAGSAPNER